jgi:hypothetical protein
MARLLLSALLAISQIGLAHADSAGVFAGLSFEIETRSVQTHKLIPTGELQTIRYHNTLKVYVSLQGNVFEDYAFSPNGKPEAHEQHEWPLERAVERNDNGSIQIAWIASGNTLTRVRHQLEGYGVSTITLSSDRKSCQSTFTFQNDPQTGRVVGAVSHWDQRGRTFEITAHNVWSKTCIVRAGNIFAN